MTATFGVGPGLVAADELPLAAGLDVAGFGGIGLLTDEGGFGTTLGAAGETAGFTATVDLGAAGRLGILVPSGLGGRGSGSSAFLFVPPTCPLVGGAWRIAGDFRSSLLGTAAGAGEEGA